LSEKTKTTKNGREKKIIRAKRRPQKRYIHLNIFVPK
jgi:hypothetical protein